MRTMSSDTGALRGGSCGELVLDVVGEQRHRLVLARPGGLVDDDLQACDIRTNLRGRDQMRARGHDRRLEDSIARAIEADELATRAVVHDRRVDAGAWRSGIDVADLELAPRARSLEHHTAHPSGGKRGILWTGNRRAGEEHDVIGEIHDGGASVAQVAKGGGLEKWLDDDP